MTNKERKLLGDVDYNLKIAFYDYETSKRLNLKQKGALEMVFKILREVFDDDNKELLKDLNKAREYFEYIGVKV